LFALGELKLVLKSRGKVFFMEQVLAPDPDRKLRPYRLNHPEALTAGQFRQLSLDRVKAV